MGKGKNKDRKKKDRKAAKKNDKKKARKQDKKKDRKRNNKNRNGNNARQASCMNAACINNAVAYMKQLKLAVKNFGKQYNRITTNEKQTGGKAGKNDEFAPYLIKLRETGGGNASNLSCNGLKNEGATNLQTLYDNLATCEDIINTTCNTNMPSVNMTFLDECKPTMDAFVNVTDGAIKATGADACLIWESAELAEMSTMLKPCSLKALETEHTSAKKACTGNFSYCRQEEDKVSKIVSACSASNSAEKVTAAIAQGVKNQAAATAVSQKVNDTLSARSAGFRSTNITCAAFSVEVTTVSAQVAAAPLLDSLETMLTTIASYVVAACSDADKSLGQRKRHVPREHRVHHSCHRGEAVGSEPHHRDHNHRDNRNYYHRNHINYINNDINYINNYINYIYHINNYISHINNYIYHINTYINNYINNFINNHINNYINNHINNINNYINYINHYHCIILMHLKRRVKF